MEYKKPLMALYVRRVLCAAFIALQMFAPAFSDAGGINEGLRQLFRKLDQKPNVRNGYYIASIQSSVSEGGSDPDLSGYIGDANPPPPCDILVLF